MADKPPSDNPVAYNNDQAQAPVGPPPTYDEVFKVEKPRYNDVWAGLLFLATCGGFVAVSAISLHGYQSSKSGNGIHSGTSNFGLTTHTMYLFGFTLIFAIVLSYGYVLVARLLTKQLIWITGILNIAWGVATAIYMLYRHYWSGGIVFIIFSVFMIIAFISWIPRIPFSVLMLQTAIDVSRRHGHVYLASFAGGLVGVLFAVWYAITLVAIYVRFGGSDSQAADPAKVTGLIVFITFAGYWISEWLKNTIHTTISGVYGSWYFNSRNYPRGVTRGALRRALTYSFGSISFGSLIVAIINFLRQLCSMAQQQSLQEGNIVGDIMFCILGCIIGIIEWVAEFVNRFAFSHIALYGQAYIPAAKATWKMIKDRGFDALINDCLVGPVLSMGAVFVAYACGLLSFLYITLTKPAYNSSGDYTPVVVAFAFLIGLQICNIVTTPLGSGIDTIFVAAAWDPEVMIRDHPDLYERMVRVYPHVQQAIHA